MNFFFTSKTEDFWKCNLRTIFPGNIGARKLSMMLALLYFSSAIIAVTAKSKHSSAARHT